MKKFQVTFTNKEWDKQITIESQDDKTVKQWSEKQLEAWGKKARITITPILIEETPKDQGTEKKETKKQRKTK